MEVREASATYIGLLEDQMDTTAIGYKQTEIGVIPEDWDVGVLGRFWTVTDCKHLTATFVSSGFPVASIREVQSRFVNLAGAQQTTQKFYILLIEGGRKPQPGDFILSRNATVGEVAQVDESHPLFAMGQDVCLLRRRVASHSTDYLQAVIQSSIVRNQLSNLMVGSTFKRANIDQIRKFVVPMPPAPEQHAIAEALSDADALIESLEQLIAKKRQIKQGTMQALLTGKQRLPGFSKLWAHVELKHLVRTPVTDGPHLTPIFLPEGIPFLSVNNLVNNKVDFADSRYISVEDHLEFSKKCRPQKGDVLLGKAASVGKVAIVDTDVEFNIWSPIALIRIGSNHDPRFVYYQLQGVDLTRQINLLTNSSSQGNIGMGDIERLVLPLPEKDEQIAIAAILTDMDSELAELETRLAKTRQLKQGMMQELLTGRIRLV